MRPGLLSFVDRQDRGQQDGAEAPRERPASGQRAGATIAQGPVLIGAFDGFHRGHARLLERARTSRGALLDEDWGAALT